MVTGHWSESVKPEMLSNWEQKRILTLAWRLRPCIAPVLSISAGRVQFFDTALDTPTTVPAH
jgi:hypothetical protein